MGRATEAQTSKRRRSLRARIGNPMSWTMADRCLTVAGILLASTLLFVATVFVLDGWPYLRLDPAQQPMLTQLSPLGLVPWLAMALWGIWARTYAPESKLLMYVTAQLYAVSIGVFTLTIGPFHSPGWVAFVGGAIVGYLLFDRLAALLGVATFGVITFGGALLIKAGRLTIIREVMPPGAIDDLSRGAISRLGITSIGFSALTITLVAFIIDRWRDREARYARLARTDGLTGALNRRKFLELAGRELQRARRYGTPLSVVLIDLDHFKRINDSRGHLAGDRVLVHAARTFEQAVRDVDTVARYGGEEFAVLLPATDAAGAHEVAERCARRLADSLVDVGGGAPVSVTASLGVAGLREGDKSLEDLLRRADEALYKAKDAGRNRVEIAA